MVGTAPSGRQHLADEVERQLAQLRDLPLTEHPRVYEQLDAAIRQELETREALHEPNEPQGPQELPGLEPEPPA